MRTFQILGGALMALALATSASATQLVTNGDFATGDFTGWSFFNDGDLGHPPAPQVTSFDVSGSGASLAAEFQVGQFPGTGVPGGGGIGQSITTTAGLLTFSADFAAFTFLNIANGSGGLFSVLLDGVTLDSFDTGLIDGLSVERGSLAFSATVTAGSHLLQLQATRPFTNGGGYRATPLQYFDNVSATQSGGAVPEPATWGLMIVGFGVTGAAIRRRRVAIS